MSFFQGLLLCPNLLMHFVNPNTGANLDGGIVTFYEDTNRLVKKPIYEIQGTPGAYTFVELPNPLILNGAGVFIDDNSNVVIPYVFPYEGTPATSTGVSQLYYITVETSGEEELYTIQGWPNPNLSGPVNTSHFENYIPNGQFLTGTNIPANPPDPAGKISADSTAIAQGGWYFVRSSGSTDTDIVLIESFDSFLTNPTGNPLNYLSVSCTNIGGGNVKDVRIRFRDVNKFASSTLDFTYYFEANSNASTLGVEVYIIKNFGSGGSTATETQIGGELTITTTWQPLQINGFVFGDNTGKTIGADSYVEIALRFPSDQLFEVEVTNFILTDGNTVISVFPPETEADVLAPSLLGWIDVPELDGNTLGLLPTLTKEGMKWDTSMIGRPIFSFTLPSELDNEILLDGSKFEVEGYSDLGIPYSRLYNKVYAPDPSMMPMDIPLAGTGSDFVTMLSGAPAGYSGAIAMLYQNSPGVVPTAADGNAGITVSTVHTGIASYGFFAYNFEQASNVLVVNTARGVPLTAGGAGTTSFTVSVVLEGNSRVQHMLSINMTTAPTAGQYFLLSSTTVDYYFWYTIDGAGSDPAVGGRTGVVIPILSTDSLQVRVNKSINCLNAVLAQLITFPLGNTLAGGEYWLFDTTGDNYYVYYIVGGNGSDPAIANRTGIRVSINGTESELELAEASRGAVNGKYFAVMDMRGQMLRGWSSSDRWLVDQTDRVNNAGWYGNKVATYQLNNFLRHSHPFYDAPNGGNWPVIGISGADAAALINGGGNNLVLDQGWYDERPFNVSGYVVCKY